MDPLDKKFLGTYYVLEPQPVIRKPFFKSTVWKVEWTGSGTSGGGKEDVKMPIGWYGWAVCWTKMIGPYDSEELCQEALEKSQQQT